MPPCSASWCSSLRSRSRSSGPSSRRGRHRRRSAQLQTPELLPRPRPARFPPRDPRRRGAACLFLQRSDWMAKEEGIEMEGVVTEVLPDRNYRVMLENGHEILAYAAGKMSKFKIRVLEGDRVSVVLSPYDLTRGRVIYRHK